MSWRFAWGDIWGHQYSKIMAKGIREYDNLTAFADDVKTLHGRIDPRDTRTVDHLSINVGHKIKTGSGRETHYRMYATAKCGETPFAEYRDGGTPRIHNHLEDGPLDLPQETQDFADEVANALETRGLSVSRADLELTVSI